MYKIGIIGGRAEVLGFMALGFDVHEATEPGAAGEILTRLADSGEYAVIFLTAELALALRELLSRYKDVPLPAITVIPGHRGSDGESLARMREAVKRAVGADILFKE